MEPTRTTPATARDTHAEATTITVLSPGARTLIQDRGRTGYAHLGVPTAGPADPTSHALANRLVGNPEAAAAFEIALTGPTLRFTRATILAYVGAEATLHLDHTPVPAGHTLTVRAGQTLTIGTLRGGVYGYLAVAGALDVPPVLGSRATCTLSGLGPAPLTAGTHLRVEAPPVDTSTGWRATRAAAPVGAPIRYLPGPHAAAFPAETLARFQATGWHVSAHTSRVGVRLDGPRLPMPQASLPSLGMVRGAIQVPPSGQPIILGPDHGTTGGYPVLGVVHPADLATLMQRPPGHRVTFTATTHHHTTPTNGEPRPATVLRLDQISA